MAFSRFFAVGHLSRGLHELGRCTGVCGLAEPEDGGGVPLVGRVGVGVRGASGDDDALPLGGRCRVNRANCVGDWCGDSWDYTAPAGSFGANGFGLHDMHGNVMEWVEDCWNYSYVNAPLDGSAWESGDCGLRVLRGGSWFNVPRHLRAANRGWVDSGSRSSGYGFRVSRTLAR